MPSSASTPTVHGDGLEPGGTSGLSLPQVLAMFLRHWKAVLLGLLGGLALAAAYILLLPPMYTAHVVIVPSVERSAASMLSAQLPAGLAGLAGGGNQDEQKLIMAIVRSRRLGAAVFDQVHAGPADPMEREFFIRQLPDRSEVQQAANGSYVIQVRDRDPETAAAIANSYPDLINAISADLGRQVVGQKMSFLRGQLDDARTDLLQSEEELLTYQRTTETPAIEEQARRTVEAAAELQRQIMQKEVEVSQLRRSATPSNPELRAALAELQTMRDQLRGLTGGESAGAVFVPLRESPELKVGELRLLREFGTSEQVYMALTAALAEAQIDARTNLPVVSVLDSATVPTASSRLPAHIVIVLFLWLGFVMGLMLALLAEYRDRLKAHPDAGALRSAWQDVLADFRRRKNAQEA